MPIGISGIDHVVGAPVECYPEQGYTEDTIAQWQRSGDQVTVEHDAADLRGLLSCIERLEDVAPDEPRGELAEPACVELAAAIVARRADQARQAWHDGTDAGTDDYMPGVPRHFAVRLAPPRLGVRDEERIARHHNDREWPWSAQRLIDKQTLHVQLLVWKEETGKYGDRPDERLCTAVSSATRVLGDRIGIAEGMAGNVLRFVDEPLSQVRGPFKIVCD